MLWSIELFSLEVGWGGSAIILSGPQDSLVSSVKTFREVFLGEYQMVVIWNLCKVPGLGPLIRGPESRMWYGFRKQLVADDGILTKEIQKGVLN